MFRLSVVDHVRLNFGHAVQNYTVHAQAAERLAGFVARVRIVVLVLLGVSFAAVCGGLLGPSRPFQIAAAVAAALAFLGYALYVALNLESRLFAHRSCAHRLWIVCERYRALLAEVQDGFVDRETILQRRDDLVAQLHGVYEQAFPVDQHAYERVRQPPQGSALGGLSDAQIDQFLPPSLRASSKPEDATAPVPH
jgi:hypothetical protein